MTDFAGKTILLIAGGQIQIPQVAIANELGLHTIVTDRDPNCSCAALADEFVPLSTYDVAGHVALALRLQRERGLDAVFTSGADVEHVVALAAAACGLPGVNPKAALATHNKAMMRRAFDRAGIPSPRWAEVDGLRSAASAIERIGYPLIVKNVDGCASRGVTIFHKQPSTQEMATAIIEAKRASSMDTALIEQLFKGPEQTVEMLVGGGEAYPCFITDRIFMVKDNYSVECGLRSPSVLTIWQQDALYKATWGAAQDLGIDFGPAKADTMWTEDGPRILEMTCRNAGGFDAQYLVPSASGKEIVKAAMLMALGKSMNVYLLHPKWNKWAVSYNPLPKPGCIVQLEGIEECRASEGVEHLFLRREVGDIVPEYKDCAARTAWIVAVGDTEKEAWANAKAASDKLIIETEPGWDLDRHPGTWWDRDK